MASIRKRGDKYIVVYDYKDSDGRRKQKYDSFTDQKEAKKHKALIEMRKAENKLLAPSKKTVAEFLNEWGPIYAKENWSYGTYEMYLTILNNHIIPNIGHIPIQEITTFDIKKLYEKLRQTRCSGPKSFNKKEEDIPFLSPTTIRHVHTILSPAFRSAVEWNLLSENPMPQKAPKKAASKRKIWRSHEVITALQNIDHPLLRLAVHTAFVCSLRIGEVVAIRWDRVNFDDSSILIDKTLQRVNTESIALIPPDELIFMFPAQNGAAKSRIVLKTPKTEESNRLVYMTEELMSAMRERKRYADRQRLALGEEYSDYDLVFSLPNGNPIEPKLCENWFKKWQSRSGVELNLPSLVFHELRHSSSTYKLVISQGDVKSVQGDTGHATAQVLVDDYAKIQDERRRALAETIQHDLYGEREETPKPEPSIELNERMAKVIMDRFREEPALLQSILQALYAQQGIK